MGRHNKERVAKAYFIGRSPMAQRWCRPVFTDVFNTHIPFYLRYAQKREDLSLQAVRDMKNTFIVEQGETEKPHKITVKERAIELIRDLKAGVFGDNMTLKELCKAHKINYDTAKNYSGSV